jgi:hypothetical protein
MDVLFYHNGVPSTWGSTRAARQYHPRPGPTEAEHHDDDINEQDEV